MTPSASIVIPTHNRHEAVKTTLAPLLVAARRAGAEVVVVDDGSEPPMTLPPVTGAILVRTPGVERSRARNAGAQAARGERLIFIDDDIIVGDEFVVQHLQGGADFGGALCVGRITLPASWTGTPFGRFRQSIEDPSQARARAFVDKPNFCTAANMSIDSDTFFCLGGFDPAILSGEDQDLALRHTGAGGQIAYLPEANGVHMDNVADIAAYGRRHEWGARAMAPFLRRYPDRPENQLRIRASTARWRRLLANSPGLTALQWSIRELESAHTPDRILFPLYRVLLGLRLFRGFRAGLKELREAPPLRSPLPQTGATR